MGVAIVPSMNSINPSTELNRLWKSLTEEFRRACLLRRQGDSEGAEKILNEELPPMISHWSRLSPSSDVAKRERLNQMFDRERDRIEDAWLTQQMLLRQMRDVLIPSLCLQVAEEVREVMELQVSEITQKLSTITRGPAEQKEIVAPEGEETSRIVSLPTQSADAKATLPNFDDLPAIIDELISADLDSSMSEHRVAALV